MILDKELFLKKMDVDGMYIVENMIDESQLKRLKSEIEAATEKETDYHGTNDHKDYGMILLCAKYGGELLKIFEYDKLFLPFEWLLGDDCIMYSNTSSSMPPKSSNYSNRIHIDAPLEYPNNYHLRVLSLIILDDFNDKNGATWFLPKSHKLNKKPTEEYFFKNAERLNVKAGSVLYWNPKIWHAGGTNHSNEWRHAFTIVMTRYFCKQRMDVPCILDRELINFNLNNKAKRRLGYMSLPPKSYEDYYGRKP